MATWVPPDTFSVREVMTSSLANNISNNLNFLHQAPACRAYNTTDTNFGNNTPSALALNSERFDNANMHAPNSPAIVIPVTGIYMVGAHCSWASNSTGIRGLYLAYNAGSPIIAHTNENAVSGGITNQSVVTCYAFNAGDQIIMVGSQSSGGTLAMLGSGNYSPEFWACWVSSV